MLIETKFLRSPHMNFFQFISFFFAKALTNQKRSCIIYITSPPGLFRFLQRYAHLGAFCFKGKLWPRKNLKALTNK